VYDGTPQAVLAGHSYNVLNCAFSPDGTLLATVGTGTVLDTGVTGTLQLWRLPDSGEPAVLTWHTDVAGRCAFSPDGTVLATTSRDGTIRLWHMTTGKCHCALRVAGPLLGIAWHPSGTFLCTTGGAGTYLLTYVP
jgi:WD40 repeat protein